VFVDYKNNIPQCMHKLCVPVNPLHLHPFVLGDLCEVKMRTAWTLGL
jgi:hypothetical protein